jgi:uncharacterized membrane protein
LAEDYCKPHYHISYMRALGRRLRRNYSWILAIQAVAYYGKVAVHPSPLQSMTQLYERAAIGPVPGQIMVPLGLAYYAALVAIAFMTMRQDRRRHGGKEKPVAMG